MTDQAGPVLAHGVCVPGGQGPLFWRDLLSQEGDLQVFLMVSQPQMGHLSAPEPLLLPVLQRPFGWSSTFSLLGPLAVPP